MQTNIAQQDRFDLPSGEEIAQVGQKAEDLDTVQMRIKENLNTLANFKERRDPERSRSDYIDLLQKVRCTPLAGAGRRPSARRPSGTVGADASVPCCLFRISASTTATRRR